MNEWNRANLWKLTAIGVVVVAVTAVVTGLVVANRTAPPAETAAVQAPSAAPGAAVAPPRPVTQAPATPQAETAPKSSVPPREVVSACNQQASAEAGSAPREGKDKVLDVAKDAGIGALGGAAVGALGGAIADGGKGAGKGAVIGGLAGAGGGTLYGIWDNKKNDERFRAAYASCMRMRGYTG